MAEMEQNRVAKWSRGNLAQDGRDFAFWFSSFQEAYTQAGRAVALAWTKVRECEESTLANDAARVLAVAATPARTKEIEAVRKVKRKPTTPEEYEAAIWRRARRVCGQAEKLTLARAVATAREFTDSCASRLPVVELSRVTAIVIESFLWNQAAKQRAATSMGWLNRNLQLDWPMDDVEVPSTSTKSAYGLDSNQAPCAQPFC